MHGSPERPRAHRLAHVLLGLWCAAVLVSLVWPVYAWVGNRFEPTILGLPLAFAWYPLLALATFGVLAAHYLATER